MMDERIKKIAEYYGFESQREQFIEECAEMIQASQKCKRNDIQNAQQYRERFDNFKEEVADVLIMALQMRVLLGEKSIDSLIDYKLDRQIQRIKDEFESETTELPKVDTEGMQSGEIRTVRNGDSWKSVMKMREDEQNEKYISVTKFKESLAKLTVEGGTEATRATIARTLGKVVPKLLDDEPSADVQPVDRWISVKDRLPDATEATVLIWIKEGKADGIEISDCCHIGYWIKNSKEFCDMDWNVVSGITHWMPLPESPKDGDVE